MRPQEGGVWCSRLHKQVPAALAYFLGLRKAKERDLLAKHDDITVLGSRETPIPYALFGDVFRPILYSSMQVSRTSSGYDIDLPDDQASRPEDSLRATTALRENIYIKTYPVFCTSLQGRDTRNLLAIEVASEDPWSLPESEFAQSYTVVQTALGTDIDLPLDTFEDFKTKMTMLVKNKEHGVEEPFESLSTADDELLTLQAGTDVEAKKALYYQKLYEMLRKHVKYETTAEGVRQPLPWHLAKSRGMVLAKQLTPEVLDFAIKEWGHSNGIADRKVDLACRNADNKEEIFFREETWGGQGTQEFALGDWIVSDIVPLDPKNIGDSTRVTIKKVFLKKDEKNVYITRTMPHLKFRQTYRSFNNQGEMPREANLGRFVGRFNNNQPPQNTMKLYNVALVGRVPGLKRTKVICQIHSFVAIILHLPL